MKRLPKVDGGGVDLGVGRDVGDGGEEEVHLAGVVGLVDGGPVELLLLLGAMLCRWRSSPRSKGPGKAGTKSICQGEAGTGSRE